MKAKKVFENLEFKRGVGTSRALNIGKHRKIYPPFNDLEPGYYMAHATTSKEKKMYNRFHVKSNGYIYSTGWGDMYRELLNLDFEDISNIQSQEDNIDYLQKIKPPKKI